jgi:hypothetical protein
MVFSPERGLSMDCSRGSHDLHGIDPALSSIHRCDQRLPSIRPSATRNQLDQGAPIERLGVK